MTLKNTRKRDIIAQPAEKRAMKVKLTRKKAINSKACQELTRKRIMIIKATRLLIVKAIRKWSI